MLAKVKTSEVTAVVGLVAATLVSVHLIASVNQADLQVFIRAGRSVLEGRSPYPKLGSGAVYAGNSFVYPYLVALAFAPLSLLGTYWGPFFFELISIASLFGAVLVFSSTLRSKWRDDLTAKLVLFALVLVASPTLISLQMGTLTPLLLGGIAILWSNRDRSFIASFVVTALAFTKVYLLVIGIFFILSQRYRAVFATAFFTALAVVANFMLSPLSPSGYYRLLSQLARHESTQGYSLINALVSLNLSKAVSYAILGAIFIATMGFWRRMPRIFRRDESTFLIAIALMLLATPILWSSYLPLLFVPMVLIVSSVSFLAMLTYVASTMVTPDRAGVPFLLLQFMAISILWLSSSSGIFTDISLQRLLRKFVLERMSLFLLLVVGFAAEVLVSAVGVQILITGVSIFVLREQQISIEDQSFAT
ncbi:MAG: glycosyltransferase family 87 protein [Actinomycetota bacterium]|nr:glycosyltransferase family 87 protein [Actinomycetota bacterium]